MFLERECNHSDIAFCPLCLPPSEEEEDPTVPKKPLPCDCGPGQKCPRCLDTGPVIKVDKIPYARMMEEKRALCKFKHAPGVTCPGCAPPVLPNYKGKVPCPKGGHRPWPEGVCLSCAPPVCVIREQVYRHCDSVSLPNAIAKAFYDNWFRSDPRKQRAALLFGRYMPEPAETKNPGAIRANVYAWYEPPQENREDGVRFLRDMDEKLVHEVAQWLGMEPVGWIVATMERKTKQGHPVFMSGAEVLQAAKFQDKYKDTEGHSRFVTVVLEQPRSNGSPVSIEPRAYQVSDQCVAAVRDELVVKSTEDPYLLATRPERKGMMPAAIVYRNKPTLPGQSFFPDEFIVKVILSTSAAPDPDMPFRHHTFPSRALISGGDLYLRQHLADNPRGELQDRLADFNILCYLAKHAGPRLATKLCAAIRNKKPLERDIRDDLTGWLVQRNLL